MLPCREGRILVPSYRFYKTEWQVGDPGWPLLPLVCCSESRCRSYAPRVDDSSWLYLHVEREPMRSTSATLPEFSGWDSPAVPPCEYLRTSGVSLSIETGR